MKTSRLKNIVIVILLLVNAFLLFLLLSRRAEERDSNERRVEQLCTLFEKNGVAFDRALLPDEETHLSLSLERDAAREEAFASALLGTAESSNSGGGVSRRIRLVFHPLRRHGRRASLPTGRRSREL